MSGQVSSERNQEATTDLYNEGGNGIRDESCLMMVLDNAGDEAWLVPAISITETPDECESDSQRMSVPTTE